MSMPESRRALDLTPPDSAISLEATKKSPNSSTEFQPVPLATLKTSAEDASAESPPSVADSAAARRYNSMSESAVSDKHGHGGLKFSTLPRANVSSWLLPIPHRKSHRRTSSQSSKESDSSLDNEGSSATAPRGVHDSEAAVAASAEPQGSSGHLGVRDAIKRKLSISRPSRHTVNENSGEGDRSSVPTSVSVTPLPSSPGEQPASSSTSEVERRASGELPREIAYLVDYSERRNRELHRCFPELDKKEIHVDDYVCALQRDILVQGRMYLTIEHVCFSSNIFGYITNLLIPFAAIQSIEKRTMLLIPNAIQINTKDGKQYFFASFVKREEAYIKLQSIFRAASAKRSNDSTASEASLKEESPNGDTREQLADDDSTVVTEAATVGQRAIHEARPKSETEGLTMDTVLYVAVALMLLWSLFTTVMCTALIWKIKGMAQRLEMATEGMALFGIPQR
ncbi:uncharacterized protein EV422DRAFT_623235 [Fimicolochytrium jonesii]|uniref:uncharacterized protein n=1 Tax=Fimicolochytrium jonesii TaxID=1396493 RepID=UPI0022FEEB57|nr:uncharacterized protein EV422DRAFT_623235 [Fimicolochytrium jonesii]KAI8816764.1 hypothetical protein EV422DRAFT_623235 [Fimicolochytrium jonesii]